MFWPDRRAASQIIRGSQSVTDRFERHEVKTFASSARPALRLTAGSTVLVAAFAVSGCVGMAPTYGTGKAADTQLMEDVSGMFSLAGAAKTGPQIDYKPRPELVKPAPGTTQAALPAPQDNIVTAAAGSQWPESPEQRRARIRATATANQDNANFEPEVAPAVASASSRSGFRATRGSDVDINGSSISTKTQRDDFNKRLAQSRQGSASERRYLSEPPLEYRVPAATAATDDVGEDEWKKDRRRKAGSTKKGSSWWPF
ncbi:MAG: hypothetical protein WBA44_18480 [Mesorhizobium sp.]